VGFKIGPYLFFSFLSYDLLLPPFCYSFFNLSSNIFNHLFHGHIHQLHQDITRFAVPFMGGIENCIVFKQYAGLSISTVYEVKSFPSA